MINRLRYILLTILLIAATQAAGQYIIDKVCVGSVRYYRVDGEAGSTYIWKLTDPSSNVTILPSTADTVAITWNMVPGIYKLSTIQHSVITNCDGVIEIGDIEVFDQPLAFAGNPITLCAPGPYQLSEATAANYSSLLWTTSGDGTFDHDTILHPVYTPGTGDLLTGSVTLTLTAQGMGNGKACTPAVSSVIIHQSAEVVAVTATATNVNCHGGNDGTATAIPTGGTGTYTYLWNDPAAQTTVKATGLYAGTYTVIVTDANLCTATASVVITEPAEILQATITSQTNVTCFGYPDGSATVTATGGTPPYSYAWNTIPVQTTSTASNLIAGTYTVIVTDTNNCTATDSVTITQPPSIMASAGPDELICETQSYTLSAATAANYSSLTWTTSGNGLFDDPTVLNPVYTPGAADITAGSVTLTLIAHGIVPCPDSSDSMVLSISRQALANAGPDTTICETKGSLTLVNATAGYYTSLLWTSSGTGTFSDASILNPVYTPSAADILNGSVVLTLTATSAAPCITVADQMTMNITQQAFAYAGPDDIICETQGSYQMASATASNYLSLLWTTSGTGTFTDPAQITPVYIPSAADIASGSVTLTLTAFGVVPCADSNNSMVLTISRQAIVNAGPDTITCETQGSLTLLNATAGYYTSLLWTSSGTGTFSDANILNPVYTPSAADILNGSVVLILTATSAAPCITVADQMTMHITQQAFAYAGPDDIICETQGSYQMASAAASDYVSILWTTSGTGTFTDPAQITPVYTPSAADIASGSVTLTLTAFGVVPCADSSNSMVLTISRQAIVNAGTDAIICETQGSFALSAATGSYYTSLLWTTSGTGSFSDPTVLNPVYTPSIADISGGSIILTLTATSASPCVDASDALILTIIRQAIGSAGPDVTICETQGSYAITSATANYYTSVIWSTSGTGTFNDPTIVNPVYTPDANDINAGSVALTMTLAGIAPCTDISDAMTLTISRQSTAYAGPDDSICFIPPSYQLSAALATHYSSLLWATSGTGTFNDPTVQNPVYTPSPADILSGLVQLTLSANSAAPCVTATDAMQLRIIPEMLASAGPDTSTCQNIPYTISGSSASNFSSILWTHNGSGILTNAFSIHPTYTAGVNESGLVTLTMKVYSLPPCTDSIIDQMGLTIWPLPGGTLSGNSTICENDTTVLTLTFYGTPPISATYTNGIDTTTITNIMTSPYPIIITPPPGTWTYTLIALNDAHCAAPPNQLLGSASVTVNPLPAVEFWWMFGSQNYEIIFNIDTAVTNLGAIGNMLLWNFGDGTFGYDSTEIHHQYPAPYPYVVTLTVTDTNGCSNSVTHIVNVPVAPTAFFDSDDPTCLEQPTCFTDLSWVYDPTTEYITTWIWNYGDGSPNDTIHFPNNPNICHLYSHADTFAVTLKVIDNYGYFNSHTSNVIVMPDPVANFFFSSTLCPDQYVSFTDASIPNGGVSILSWNWNFADPGSGLNNTSNLVNPTHIFTHGDSTYNVRLIVVNFNNCTDTLIKPVYIHPKPPVNFTYDTACLNQLVYFNADTVVTKLDSIASWSWDFGDGTPPVTDPINTSHVYIAVGVYTVTLTITDIHSCTNFMTHTIEVNPLPVAVFTWAAPVCHNSAVQYTDHSYVSGIFSGYIVKWLWDFGDGTTQTVVLPASPNVSHTFVGAALSHMVRLTVWTNDSCTSYVEHIINSIPKPIANFDYSIVNCSNQPVQFTDLSQTGGGGNIAQWAWDFGDPGSGVNNFSTLQNPSHTYIASGTYSIKLTVINVSNCFDTITKTITINVKPVADFSADTACFSNPTTFTDLSIPNATAIISYSWDFGDGSPLSAQTNPVHTYANYGLFTVTLTITNSNGCTHSVTKQVLVNPLPIATFTFTTPNCQSTPVCFTDISTTPPGYLGNIVRWVWVFGDGTPDSIILYPTSPNVCHTFPGTALTHVVRLMVTTSDSCSHFVEHTINSVPSPIANFGFSTTNCTGQTVQFNDLSQMNGGGPIISWNWNFGDPISGLNNTSTLQNPAHSFATANTYNVTLIINNINNCFDTIIKSITIDQLPVADFHADTVCVDNPTTFTDMSTPNATSIISYSWNFGDGSPANNSQNPIHTYINYGVYTVTLTITNSNGCINSVSKQVLVNPLPIAAFSFLTPNCLGTPVCYVDLSTMSVGYFGNIVKWVWDFGDGTPDTTILLPANPNVCHTFAGTALSHVVRLTVTTSDSCTHYIEQNVNSSPAPVAAFTFNSTICQGQAVQFSDLSQPTGGVNIIQWNWNFGDPASGTNNLSELQNPSHNFTAPGAFTVTLVVMNLNLCSDTITHVVNVNMKPVADFSADTACIGNPTQFTDQSIPNAPAIISYSWNFGDSSPLNTQMNPVHTYSNYGLFNVTLTIVNSNGCTKDTTHSVFVRPLPLPAFTFTAPNCLGTPVFYTDLSTTVPGYSDPIISWTWEFGDGSTPVIINFPASSDISHTFLGNALAHTVRLTINTLSGCSAYVENIVNSVPVPVADFTFPGTNCSSQSVQFTDLSQMNGGGPIVTWNWNFGDPGSGANNNSNAQNPVHIFSGYGTFAVTLIVFNSGSCSDTIQKSVSVSANPVASFTSDTACLGSLTTFTDQSTVEAGSGTISAHFWEFGDGGTSTQTNPTHLYANDGTYAVTLTVTTTHGCTKDTTIQVLVHPLPTAAFSFSSSACVGDSVQFTDLSTTLSGFIVRWKWEFGDGQTKIINYPTSPNVRHAYANAGTFNVTLTVTTSDSCNDHKILPITIYAKPQANFEYATIRCQFMPVQFTDISQGIGGVPVVSWLWNFDDPGSGTSNTSTLQNPSHTFLAGGTFNVLLTVTNANGCIDSIIKPVIINAAPVAQFTADTACIDNPTHFTDGSTPGSGTLVAWQWDFGDPASGTNNTSTQQNPSHIYGAPGTYYVTLIVINSNSCERDTVIPINVNPAPDAMFSYTASCVGDSTQFTDLSIAPGSQITDWLWDFGDGGTSTLQSPKHAYMASGTYDVQLMVMNLSGCTDSIVLLVIARPKPIADYVYTNFFCPAGQVNFQDQSEGIGAAIAERLWIFEPGYTSTLVNPIHTFSVTDTTYLVTLIVTDNYGCKDTIIDSTYVKPGFGFTFNLDTVCFGNPTHFTPQNLAPGDSLFFVTWDFGDPASGSNNISYAYRPVHIFTQSGTFIVKMKAWNWDNCVDSVYKSVTVRGLPQTLFTSTSEPYDNVVHFTDKSLPGNGTITQWEWTFGDGTPPIIILSPGPGDTSHIYVTPGDYTVTLKVTNSYGCSGTFSDLAHTVPYISASFTQEKPSCARYQVTFSDNSLPVSIISSWHWFWGDGSDTTYSDYASNIQHRFADPGNYIVTLVIKALIGTAQYTDTTTQQIAIGPTSEAFFSNMAVCMNKTTLFQDKSETFGEQTISWNWNFGEPLSGSSNTSSSQNPSHKYDTAGVYPVKLVVMNKFGCKDSLIKPTRVFGIPKAGFTSSIACESNPTYFYDRSKFADTLTSYWLWNFGDANSGSGISSFKDPVHRYKSEGNYLVHLLVEDYNGCNDTCDSTITVNPSPVSSFTVTENVNGMAGKIQLNNHSSGATSYLWEFGNGISSAEENPVATYTLDGTFVIKLISSNQFNCTDTTYYKYDMLFKGLYIPNAFSPTNSNLAVRLFKPVGKNLKQYNIQVYDSWGHLLWESSKIDSEGRPLEGWDGTYKGTMMPQATYMWKAIAIFIDDTIWEGSDIGKGESKTMGTVSLIR